MDSSNTLFWTFAYDFIRGPMVWVAFAVFFGGTLFQIFKFLSFTKQQTISKLTPGPGRFIPKRADNPKGTNKKDWALWLKLSIAGVNPFMTIVSTTFHVLLIVMPIFVLGHNILLDNAFGISFFSLSESVSDSLTLIVIICAAIFLYRRLFLGRVKAITTWEDYLFLFLAAAPFLTGYLAYHQVLNYKLIISLHILSGEIMLMAVPFTKFVHMIYLVIFRFTVVSEYSLGKGDRTW
jgi:nitrate reductase gamma subunit